jgi:hypothetical protein
MSSLVLHSVTEFYEKSFQQSKRSIAKAFWANNIYILINQPQRQEHRHSLYTIYSWAQFSLKAQTLTARKWCALIWQARDTTSSRTWGNQSSIASANTGSDKARGTPPLIVIQGCESPQVCHSEGYASSKMPYSYRLEANDQEPGMPHVLRHVTHTYLDVPT